MAATVPSKRAKTPGKKNLSDRVNPNDLIEGEEYLVRSDWEGEYFQTWKRVRYSFSRMYGPVVEILEDDFLQGHDCDGAVPSNKGWYIDPPSWKWKLPFTAYDPDQQPFTEDDI